jgi:hypothetical protein
MNKGPSEFGLKKFGAAVRPSVLFATAFALVTTPHEAAHAATAYMLGFNLTLFKMWVDPDAASATPGQTAAIAVAGPIFSLVLGVAAWLLYRIRFKQCQDGLLLLMLAIVGLYSFLGPMAAAAFGGDFNVAIDAIRVPQLIAYAVSAAGLILLSIFMVYMGRELLGWARPDDSRLKSIITMTLAPCLLGILFVLLIYWPLPKFILGPTIVGSIFWLFAVAGAIFSKVPPSNVNAASTLTLSDLIAIIVAVGMVWSMTRNSFGPLNHYSTRQR